MGIGDNMLKFEGEQRKFKQDVGGRGLEEEKDTKKENRFKAKNCRD